MAADETRAGGAAAERGLVDGLLQAFQQLWRAVLRQLVGPAH
jgi:hypothetical protein